MKLVFFAGNYSKMISIHHRLLAYFGSKLNLFFKVTLCLENLSSGENLAGCADFVISPDSVIFFNV